MTHYKQAIVLRADLGMGKGKLVAQGAHASLGAYRESSTAARKAWESMGEMKITLKVSSEQELTELFLAAKAAKLPACLIHDAGHTQIPAGSATAVAIGPADELQLDVLTGKLKLL